jgi:hypothetical protein
MVAWTRCRCGRYAALLTALVLSGVRCGDALRWNDSIILVVSYDLVLTTGGRLLYATPTAVNTGDLPLVGSTGGCAWEFSAYRDPQRAGTPAWSQDFEHSVCTSIEIGIDIPPRGSQKFPPSIIPYAEIFDSSGPGTYYFAARLRGGPGGWWTDRLPAGSYEILPP